jgi:hypothetical protein
MAQTGTGKKNFRKGKTNKVQQFLTMLFRHELRVAVLILLFTGVIMYGLESSNEITITASRCVWHQ